MQLFEAHGVRIKAQGTGQIKESMENSERDGSTRPPDLPLEKPICRS